MLNIKALNMHSGLLNELPWSECDQRIEHTSGRFPVRTPLKGAMTAELGPVCFQLTAGLV